MGSPAADKALHNSFPSPGVPSRDRPFLNVHQFLFASYFVTLSEQKKKADIHSLVLNYLRENIYSISAASTSLVARNLALHSLFSLYCRGIYFASAAKQQRAYCLHHLSFGKFPAEYI
jgi:hypothetical protein